MPVTEEQTVAELLELQENVRSLINSTNWDAYNSPTILRRFIEIKSQFINIDNKIQRTVEGICPSD